MLMGFHVFLTRRLHNFLLFLYEHIKGNYSLWEQETDLVRQLACEIRLEWKAFSEITYEFYTIYTLFCNAIFPPLPSRGRVLLSKEICYDSMLTKKASEGMLSGFQAYILWSILACIDTCPAGACAVPEVTQQC